MTDQPTLRDRIADVLDECRTLIPSAQADAVLAVLLAPADRAAGIARAVADLIVQRADDLWRPGTAVHFEMLADAAALRRMADEAQQPEEAGR